MEYKEIKGNLFDAPKDAYLVHCISADFALGAGIAVEFNKRSWRFGINLGFLEKTEPASLKAGYVT